MRPWRMVPIPRIVRRLTDELQHVRIHLHYTVRSDFTDSLTELLYASRIKPDEGVALLVSATRHRKVRRTNHTILVHPEELTV